MVTFLTLLLGLIVGERRIDLAVDERVASVEVWLDRSLVGVVRAPPWSLTCDFGEALVPHLLEAVARDAEGRELHRAVQRVNLPRDPAEVTLVLRASEEAGQREVEVVWSAPGQRAPEEIQLHFDGEPLQVLGRRAALPPHDLRRMHIVTAQLVFAGQLRATAELAFGGEFGEQMTSELTAIALEPDTRSWVRRLPSAAAVAADLRVAGAAPLVVAVERGPVELVVVRAAASLAPLRRLRRQIDTSAGLRDQDVMRVVSSRPLFVAGDGDWAGLFSVSQDLNRAGGGLGWALTNLFFDAGEEGSIERLDEAVAVAGLRAAASNRPRAVLLVNAGDAGEEGEGPSLELGPAAVREYLAALRVPFFYWRVGAEATADGWGTPTPVRNGHDLEAAAAKLGSTLRRQFVAWLDGQHLPVDVTTAGTPSAPLRLAGAGGP
jgi:hypothetical protein